MTKYLNADEYGFYGVEDIGSAKAFAICSSEGGTVNFKNYTVYKNLNDTDDKEYTEEERAKYIKMKAFI